MAHNIANIGGKSSIAYVGDTPWHRLGTPVAPGIQLADAYGAASLNWDVKAIPTFAEFNGTRLDLPVQAIVRETDSEVLGTVGPRYTPIQHRQAFDAFGPAIAAGQVRLEVIGSLGKGEVVWMLLKLAEDAQSIRTLKNGQPDIVLPYINASLAHDGSRNFTVKPTGVRVVCANTLSAADGEGHESWVSIRHTESGPKQLAEVSKVLATAADRYKTTVELFRKLAGVTITESELVDYVNAVLPLPEKPRDLVRQAQADALAFADALLVSADIVGGIAPEKLVDEKLKTLELRYATETARVESERVATVTLATTGKGNDGSSLWDAYNGVTEFVDHTARRDTDYAKDRAAFNAIAGDGAALKSKALKLAIKTADLVAA
jgi:phage/plasmid-like protein (TIGR03299 family)